MPHSLPDERHIQSRDELRVATRSRVKRRRRCGLTVRDCRRGGDDRQQPAVHELVVTTHDIACGHDPRPPPDSWRMQNAAAASDSMFSGRKAATWKSQHPNTAERQ